MTEMVDEKDCSSSGLDRRTAIVRGGAAFGSAMAASLLPSAEARAQGTSANPFTVVGAGELMVTRRLMQQTEGPFRRLVERMRNADLCYAHLEMNLGTAEELKWTPRGTAGVASYMNADPTIAEDLAEMGVDALSLAHNHSFDWGPEGIFSTIRAVEAAGIAHAGTGANLMVARAPAFFDVDEARVAMISVGSGNNQFEWAGLPLGSIQGRPGMNPLRVNTRYIVDAAAAAQLKEIGQKLGVLSAEAAARPEFNITPGTGVGGTGTAAFSWVEGDRFAITSSAHQGDVEGNLRSVRWAREMADFVMLAHHNSTSEGSRSENPSDFVVDFARKAIDAGAHVYWGHGWHSFLGIEIYQGRPIVYGMGNFVYQSGHLTRVPADSFESYGRDLSDLAALYPTGDMHPGGGEDWHWSTLIEMDHVDGQLRQIRLYPVEMGMDFSGGTGVRNRTVGSDKIVDGTPYLASGANARAILQRIQQRNALRGTRMEIQGEVGVINV